MSRRVSVFLSALAAFMIFEWINLGFNLQDGHETSFYVVHGVLIAVNVILAVVLGTLGVRGLLATRGTPGRAGAEREAVSSGGGK
ncbi:SCO4848 family membrane protein [Sphaerimonospora mesophila]|uniref:SCO4848 family membrane protein n=1 Tax=Sphaerimonospora mesophila TaxID=37483 RepID=UPI0006E27EDF